MSELVPAFGDDLTPDATPSLAATTVVGAAPKPAPTALDFSDCVPSPFQVGQHIRLSSQPDVRGVVTELTNHGFKYKLYKPAVFGHPLAGTYDQGEVYSRSWYQSGGFEIDPDPTGEHRRMEEWNQVAQACTGSPEIERLEAEVQRLKAALQEVEKLAVRAGKSTGDMNFVPIVMCARHYLGKATPAPEDL
jgi:hypothetical protein